MRIDLFSGELNRPKKAVLSLKDVEFADYSSLLLNREPSGLNLEQRSVSARKSLSIINVV